MCRSTYLVCSICAGKEFFVLSIRLRSTKSLIHMLEMEGEPQDPVRVERSRRNQWTQEEEENSGRRGKSEVKASERM